MNRCDEIQNRVLTGASLSQEEKDHLSGCKECCGNAAFAARLEQLPGLEQTPPAYLDDLILRAARQRKSPWIPRVWKVALPAAAAFALAAGALFYQNLPAGGSRKSPAAIAVQVPTQEISFEDQVFTLAMDVGSGMNTFSETMDLVI